MIKMMKDDTYIRPHLVAWERPGRTAWDIQRKPSSRGPAFPTHGFWRLSIDLGIIIKALYSQV